MVSLGKAARMARHPITALRELRTVRYFANQVPTFSDRPWFDDVDLKTVTERIDSERVVLEYGAGSSTLFFAQHARQVHSVDSSRSYVSAVLDEAARLNLSNIYLSPVDIGMVRDWGWPIDTNPTAKNRRKWKRYVEAPWESMGQMPVCLVIIDGRFRVACAAYSIAKLLDDRQRDFTIFLDDFVGRESSYGQLNEIASLERSNGRGVFLVPKDTDGGRARDFAERYYTDPS